MDQGLFRGITFFLIHISYLFAFISILNSYLSINLYNMNAHNRNYLTVTSWNMNKKFRTAKPYLYSLLENTTIMVLNEHALFPKELFKLKSLHPDFNAFGRASRDLDDIAVQELV